jgi:hypothetical protein
MYKGISLFSVISRILPQLVIDFAESLIVFVDLTWAPAILGESFWQSKFIGHAKNIVRIIKFNNCRIEMAYNGRGFVQLGYLLLCPPTPQCKLRNEMLKPIEITSTKRSTP